jgi:hypothetical protein
MPLMFRAMNIEKVMGAEQRHVIDWDARVTATSVTTSTV